MTSHGVGGVSVAGGRLYCSDKSSDGREDIWLCLDAMTGKEMWRLREEAAGRMDYTNTPRASPVIHGNRVYLFNAFGVLVAADARTGARIWRRDLPAEFGGSVPTWGFCATPLVVGRRIIVPAGSPRASLVALDAETGSTVWVCPGRPPGYGNMIAVNVGGFPQVVWHDSETLGGWDVRTGKRLWTVKPEAPHDFNVPTPALIGTRLLVATENNGARLYRFLADGRLTAKPIAHADSARPNTASPVIIDETAWVASEGGLFALDIRNRLKVVWKAEESPFLQHASLFAAPGRVLGVLLDGTVFLLPSRPAPDAKPLLRKLPVLSPLEEDEVAVWSHPALVGDRLYVRTNRELLCVSLR